MKVLFIAAHLDDELTSGATLNKLVNQGHEVTYLGLSWCDSKELINECQLALATIQVTDIHIENFLVRNFSSNRQAILDKLIYYREKIKPEMVFCPSSFDIHQDHQTVHNETKRAFKCSIFGYEFPWNYYQSSLTCPSEITQEQLSLKIKAMSQYTSQQGKPYFNPKFIESLAIVRGVQYRVPLAEGFETIRTSI